MLNHTATPTDPNSLDAAIALVLSELTDHSALSEEHDKLTTQLERLYALKNSDKPEARKRVSGDAVVGAVASFLSVVVILGAEKAGLIANSKAFGFVKK